MATARPGTPGAPDTPRPEQPTTESRTGTAGLRRTRSLPEGLGVPLPPRRLSPVTPLPPGEPPAPEIPPDALAVTADLRWLTWRAAGEDNRRLPPLLASLTRRTQALRLPVTPRQCAPTPPRLPAPRAAAPWASPNHVLAEEVTLRPHPPLCRDAGGDTAPDPLGVRELYRELYRELGRTFPTERLRFHRELLVEPAATVADLLPAGPQNAGEPLRRGDGRGHGRRQTVGLFDDYLSFVAATGSDFLGAIFHRDGEEAVGAPWLRRESAPAPAEPSEGGLRVPKHRGDNKTRQRSVGGCPPPAPPRHRC